MSIEKLKIILKLLNLLDNMPYEIKRLERKLHDLTGRIKLHRSKENICCLIGASVHGA